MPRAWTAALAAGAEIASISNTANDADQQSMPGLSYPEGHFLWCAYLCCQHAAKLSLLSRGCCPDHSAIPGRSIVGHYMTQYIGYWHKSTCRGSLSCSMLCVGAVLSRCSVPYARPSQSPSASPAASARLLLQRLRCLPSTRTLLHRLPCGAPPQIIRCDWL